MPSFNDRQSQQAPTWALFRDLSKTDRSCLAFCVGPVALAIFQPLILARANNGSFKPLDYAPFGSSLGLLRRPSGGVGNLSAADPGASEQSIIQAFGPCPFCGSDSLAISKR
jgi:hypothetical protein